MPILMPVEASLAVINTNLKYPGRIEAADSLKIIHTLA